VDAAFVADCVPAAALEALPAFHEELVIIAPRSHPPIRRPQDVRADTLIAFPSGCAYRRRLLAWLSAGGVLPEKSLELASYHAIIACVASGTGIAIVPLSVTATVRDMQNVAVYPLGATKRKAWTSLVWRKGDVSSALRALQAQVSELREA
jgi:DNA-binding transcriptional LysR family regulator